MEHILHLAWKTFTFRICFTVFDIKRVGYNNKQVVTRLDTKETFGPMRFVLTSSRATKVMNAPCL